jgi:hypothetical protein
MGREVMLVGSVPLAHAEDDIRMASTHLGRSAKMFPDGETGPRSKFISWQEKVFAKVEQLSVTPLGPQSEWGKHGELPPRTIQLRSGAHGEPDIPRIGYAAEARAAFDKFQTLQKSGALDPTLKFQICLPTPLGVLSAFGDSAFQEFCEPRYRARMMEDLDEISQSLAHSKIVVQWDLPLEIAIWEGHVDTYLADPRRDVVLKLCELIEHLPADIEQGLHLCYGDVSHQHWKEPDLMLMVEFANFVQQNLRRAIDYVHIPIPRSWTHAKQFEALGALKLRPPTRVFLGLVHATDGIKGANRRIEAATTHLSQFGLAAECGLGRRNPADIPSILDLHREAADLVGIGV